MGSGVGSRGGSGVRSLTGSGVGSRGGSGVGSLTGSGVGSLIGSGVGSRTGSGVGSRMGSGFGSQIDSTTGTGSGVGSADFSCTASRDAADGSTATSVGGSGPERTAAAVATAATAAATSFSGSVAVAALGPRLTGVGVLLPTVFLGLEVLVGAALEPGALEGVGLLSCVLERLGVFASAALLVAGFLAVTSDFEADLGVSGFADFVVEEGRVRGESASFLAAGVDGLVTSKKENTQKHIRSGLIM